MSRAPSPPPSLSPTLAPTVAIMQTPPSTDALNAYPSRSSSPPPPIPTALDNNDVGRSSQSESEPRDSAPAPPTIPPVPAQSQPILPAPAGKSQYAITLLLVSGRRRTLNFDLDTSVGTLKDTIWNTWPAEWADERPPSASFLRILYLGRILSDETLLSSLNLPSFTSPSPNHPQSTTAGGDAGQTDSLQNHPLSEDGLPVATVFHVSVRSFAPAGEDDLNKSKKGKRRRILGGTGNGGTNGAEGTPDVPTPGAPERQRSGCCGCIIC